jgi:sugar lactone lactonase YvrE
VTRAEQITGVITVHGEGACWDGHALTIVDMLAGDLVTVRSDGSHERRHVAEVAAVWRPRAGGGVVVGTDRGVTLVDAGGATSEIDVLPDPGVRMNEGVCDPRGRFFCGSMTYDGDPGRGELWRLDPDLSVRRVDAGLSIPNGMAWSPDGTLAYHIDTPTGRVDAYHVGTDGDLAERHPVVTVTGGFPDGMTLDADGNIWVALWGGRAVHGYSPAGELLDVVEVAAEFVTSCAFGGDGYTRLFVTTSRRDLADGDPSQAGAVFVADVGAHGVPPVPFGA